MSPINEIKKLFVYININAYHMNGHDKAITDELQINSFIEKKSISAKVSDTKALVINLSSYFLKGKLNESEYNSSLFDELDYGNYE